MALKREYHSMNGRLEGQYDSTAGHLGYAVDALGSVAKTVDSSGTTQRSMQYKPWGEVWRSTGPGSTPKFNWVGTYGYYSTGIHYEMVSRYVRARHFSGVQGAWITVDPIWPGERAYSYINGRVTSRFDPRGLKPCPMQTGSYPGQANPYPKDPDCPNNSFMNGCIALACSGKAAYDLYTLFKKFLKIKHKDIPTFVKSDDPITAASKCCKKVHEAEIGLLWWINPSDELIIKVGCKIFENKQPPAGICRAITPSSETYDNDCNTCCDIFSKGSPDTFTGSDKWNGKCKDYCGASSKGTGGYE